jgi:hypothetical protein
MLILPEGKFTYRSYVLGRLEPGLLITLMGYICRLRWDESLPIPLAKVCYYTLVNPFILLRKRKVLLLMWKSAIVIFGDLDQVEKAKASFKDPSLAQSDSRGQPIITASPLDYHFFRQEISSKYPAYNPPPPLFPLEPENNSILPPLKNHPNKAAGSNVFGSGLSNGNATSILHQPVHIATPAPSPPPSPAGPGGKGGKKQNYQTNQLFPFLYPPLDETSNNLGGKGSTDLQDLLVGRKWEGADIPASILEAAELFAKRMRATRAMKQLWEVRIEFMRYERGWIGSDDKGIEPLNLEDTNDARTGDMATTGGTATKEDVEAVAPGPTNNSQITLESGSIEERLAAVETFYVRDPPT